MLAIISLLVGALAPSFAKDKLVARGAGNSGWRATDHFDPSAARAALTLLMGSLLIVEWMCRRHIEWGKNGNDTCIIAADYSHLRTAQPVIERDLDCTYEDGVKYRWLKTNRYAGNGLARVANMMTFDIKLTAHAKQIAEEKRPSVVICSSIYPFDVFAGERIARLAGAKLVSELHDVWPLTPMLLGNFSRYHPFIQATQYAEDRCYRVAGTVVSILPNTKRHALSRGMLAHKFAHIPNRIPIDEIAQPPTNFLSRSGS